ncbi:MAG: protein kinase, partial [Acidobacteria bacterium]|nr:protein kinase [Acidobacteriota bacterium]
FIAMEYVDGQTLKSMIPPGGLPTDTVVTIGIQISDAIAHAHNHGVIHRDLKSVNVIVLPDNRVKVLDFGLAIRRMTATDETMTETNTLAGPNVIAGTLMYMAPEVLRGEPADTPSDIWAVGVLLYEMTTGERPFAGSTPYELTGAILHSAPKPLPAAVPAGLRTVIERALEKDPQRRFSSASELRASLESFRIGSTTIVSYAPERSSLLVLPFVNLSHDDSYFSDGLTDEIITDLSAVQALRVISRTSSMRLKGTTEEISKIASDMRVTYVLEGAVRQIGSQLRVTAKLIDISTDSPVWANKYSGNIDDIFAIQEEISRNIVQALKVKLTTEEEAQIAERPITDVRAYESYLKAKREMLRYSKEALDKAVEYLQTSISIAGENTLLLSALGQAYWQYVNAGFSSDPAYLDKADDCARRILSREADSHHGHRLLGLVRAHRGDFQGSMKQLKRALAGDPNDPDTLLWLCVFAGACGKAREAAPWAERLLEVDPLTPLYQVLPAVLAMFEGDFEHALEMLSKSYTANLDNPAVRLTYGQVLALNGRFEQAYTVFDALQKEMPDSPFAQLGVFYEKALRDEPEAALASVNPELESAMGADPQYSWMFAQCYAVIGERERALDWLQRAVALGFINYPLLARFDPLLENLRSEPHFQTLIRKVESRWKDFEL